MRLGLWGARGDAGGLGAMTFEFHRHLRPERTMVIDLEDRGRGPCSPERFTHGEVRVNKGMNDAISEETVRSFLDGLDVVYMAETTYYEPFCDMARQMGVRTILHAMPELYRAGDSQPDEIWLPTNWEADRVPGALIVPVPIPTDTFRPDPNRTRAQAQRGTILHLAGPAFHDRDGTDLVVAAMADLSVPAKIVFAGAAKQPPSVANRRGLRLVSDWRPGAVYDRRSAYPDDCGALLLPRRYAGLSLPMQEAAALGWPIISLDLAPQNEWLHPGLMAPAYEQYPVRMGGGTFPVHGCNPHHLARCIARLISEPEVWAEARQRSLDYAWAHSWLTWADRYRDLLTTAGTGGGA